MVKRELLRSFGRSFRIVSNAVSNSVKEKAKKFIRERRVRFVSEFPVEENGQGFLFDVQGDTDEYETKLILKPEDFELGCSCKTRGYFCSHQLSVLVYIYDNIDGEIDFIDTPTDNIYDYRQPYSHDQVNIPLIGLFFGIELEFKGNITLLWELHHREIKSLLEKGWKLKHDASVDIELVSPILEKQKVLYIFERYETFFKTWGQMTVGTGTGLHVHVAFDRMFSVGKKPKRETISFIKSLINYFEENIEPRRLKEIFGRNYNRRWASRIFERDDRYTWINLNPLYRDVGKTLEIRLGSAKRSGDLPRLIEAVEFISKYIANGLILWRREGRPNFDEFINQNKPLLKKVFDKQEIVKFLKLFKPEALRKV